MIGAELVMSSQQSQRVRRNPSPGSTKQGPIRATVPLSLMHQSSTSPTRSLHNKGSPNNSPTLTWSSETPRVKPRYLPDSRISPESQIPGSPGFKAEKSKTLNIKSGSSTTFIRRTASVDTIYLLGQWQRDALYSSYCGRLMMDRATQTPEEFEETERKSSVTAAQKKNSASGDQFEMKYIRQRLQRTNQNNRAAIVPSSYQRHSPVHGDHFAISSCGSGGTTSPVLPSTTSPAISPHQLSYSVPTYSTPISVAITMPSASQGVPIPIPHIPKPLIPRMRSSVEGLNQEIERLVLREISGTHEDDGRALDPTPEGHRAPIADLFRTTHTQTPFSGRDSYPSSDTPSRSHSISPITPQVAGPINSSRPSSIEDVTTVSPEGEISSKLGTSPHINRFLAREPPDGCEKVKIAEETRNSAYVEPQKYGYPKPSMNFVLLPSQSSAFYPPCKNCVSVSSEEISTDQSVPPSHSSGNERLQ